MARTSSASSSARPTTCPAATTAPSRPASRSTASRTRSARPSKGPPIYTGAAEVKGNSITALNGESVRKGAKVGRSFTVRFFTRDGQRVTKKLTLRAERKGDDAGEPLSR